MGDVEQNESVVRRFVDAGNRKGFDALGPFPPSGARADVQVEALFRIEGGRIAELWTTWDNLAVLTQLGHLPTPAVRD